jgi:aminoglycoside 6'-N-acetyltransferase I
VNPTLTSGYDSASFSGTKTKKRIIAPKYERLVGFLEASIRPFVEDCDSDHVGYLEGWFVEPDSRHGGVGKELVLSAEGWARQKGCTEMASDADIGNDRSIEAHTNLGYVETSRLVHLRKELS